METRQDLFISHAGADKEEYILPLSEALAQEHVTFWLDSAEIGWGDSIALKINEGLRESRFVLLCLSQHFIERPWPESELNAALSVQNSAGTRRVLPLILNAKQHVLARYPLLSGIAYREYSSGPRALAGELARLVRLPASPERAIRVIFESAHTGKVCNLSVSPRSSLRWLSRKGQAGLGVSERADTGGFAPFRIKWVLVDVTLSEVWYDLPRAEQRRLRAVIASSGGPQFSYSDRDRLLDIGIYDGVVFHMFPVEDEIYYERMGDEAEGEHGPPE